MEITQFQQLIKQLYDKKDRTRGVDKTFVWFVEEVGELARALHRNHRHELEEEFADCFAWLATLANLTDIDLETAIKKYQHGCNKCHHTPCKCVEEGI